MNTKLFLLLLCCMPLSLAAQENRYEPVLEAGRKWCFTEETNYMFNEADYEKYGTNKYQRQYSVYVCGDTEDDGTLGKKRLCWAYDNDGFDERLSIKDKYIDMAERGPVLYAIDYHGTESIEYPLLDFSMKTGDCLRVMVEQPNEQLYVLAEDSIHVKGRGYRRLTIGTRYGKVLDYWVEGIGARSIMHFITDFDQSLRKTDGGMYYFSANTRLTAVYENGECIFEYADFERTDNAALYQASPYHETAVLVAKQEAGKPELRHYSACPEKAANGTVYYRWYTGPGYGCNIGDLPSLPFYNPATSSFKPMMTGYRFDNNKMLIYDFQSDTECVGLDFSLNIGERFTTPNGVEWEVTGREMRMMETTRYGQNTDYKGVHACLAVRSVDGTMEDEWVENVGAIRYPLQLGDPHGFYAARTLYMQYDYESSYIVFESNSDPIYNSYVFCEKCVPGSFENEECIVTADGNTLMFTLNTYCHPTRYCCYAYRCGDNLMVGHTELGPFMDWAVSPGILRFSFTGMPVPQSGAYTATLSGKDIVDCIPQTASRRVDGQPYDLLGRRMDGNTQHGRGLYIKDGKKFMEAR